MTIWLYSTGSEYEPLVGSCDHSNKNFGFTNYTNFRQLNEHRSLMHIGCLVYISTYEVRAKIALELRIFSGYKLVPSPFSIPSTSIKKFDVIILLKLLFLGYIFIHVFSRF